MLVMRAEADVDPDVVEECGHLQQQPFAIGQPMFVAQLRRTAASRA